MPRKRKLPILLIPNKKYLRKELHRKLGGNPQTGISCPVKYPVVLLFSSDTGKKYGYSNVISQSGTNLFTGVGQTGDMKFTHRNAEVYDHQRNNKDLHVFKEIGGGYWEYIGQMVYIGHRIYDGPDKDGNTRKIIQFALSPNIEG